MPPTEVFAPAKINLTLHVTGQRVDGYHLLDSYVVFADVGDIVRVTPAPEMSLRVTGPMAPGVPEDASNLCWKAALAFGETVEIELEKHLPPASGIGGGSSDAAAVLKAMEQAFERPFTGDPLALGADVPVCMLGHAAQMKGIGDYILPLYQEPDHAVLVNPGIEVSTPAVFRALESKTNPAMTPWPEGGGFAAALAWFKSQRNDLQPAALALEPGIGAVLDAVTATGAPLARMSGSGATCFGLYETAHDALRAANTLSQDHPDWWVKPCQLS